MQVSGTQFTLNGRPTFFAGTNNYYQMSARRQNQAGVNDVMDQMQLRRMGLMRTWAFNDLGENTWDCLLCVPRRQLTGSEKPIDFISEQTLVGLDKTIAAADARKIRLVLTFVNNWDDYGGMNRWTLWRYGTANHDQFYSDATIKTWFKQYLSYLINRVNTQNGRLYRDEPAIFAWELANEPRAASSQAANLNAWIGEMSAYVKSLDPNHLVAVGTEGFYGPGANAWKNNDSWMTFSGMDFITNHQHATIDFATCHIWPENWGWNPIGSTASARGKSSTFLQHRINDAQSILGKPLLLEEFGIPRDNKGRLTDTPLGATTIRDSFYDTIFYQLCEVAAENGGACGATANWIIFDTFHLGWDDGNGVYLPWDPSTDAIVTSHSDYMTALRRGDLDFDGDVDGGDIDLFLNCHHGPGQAPGGTCHNADLDNDDDVDQADFGLLQRCLSGPENPFDPVCTM